MPIKGNRNHILRPVHYTNPHFRQRGKLTDWLRDTRHCAKGRLWGQPHPLELSCPPKPASDRYFVQLAQLMMRPARTYNFSTFDNTNIANLDASVSFRITGYFKDAGVVFSRALRTMAKEQYCSGLIRVRRFNGEGILEGDALSVDRIKKWLSNRRGMSPLSQLNSVEFFSETVALPVRKYRDFIIMYDRRGPASADRARRIMSAKIAAKRFLANPAAFF